MKEIIQDWLIAINLLINFILFMWFMMKWIGLDFIDDVKKAKTGKW